MVIDEALTEDLIIFSTGALGSTAQIAASFVAGEPNPLSLRQQTLDIEFIDANNYEITDRASGTVLAQRAYEPGSPISYQGLQVELSDAPAAGDRFEINNNGDGVGSTDNLIRLADIETMVFGDDEQTIQQGLSDVIESRRYVVWPGPGRATSAGNRARSSGRCAGECCRSKSGRRSGKFNQVSAVLSGVCAANSDRKPIV